MRITPAVLITIGLTSFAFVTAIPAQFIPDLLQNKSYWGGGKSEFNLYQAEFVRDGQPRPCELLIIFTPKVVDAANLGETSNAASATIPIIEMNETATVPHGLVMEQRSIRAVWLADVISLARLSFTG